MTEPLQGFLPNIAIILIFCIKLNQSYSNFDIHKRAQTSYCKVQQRMSKKCLGRSNIHFEQTLNYSNNHELQKSRPKLKYNKTTL